MMLVRVCCMEECKRPFRIFGCSYSIKEKNYCDDCKLDRPQTYRNCTIRTVSPPVNDATHGLCRECALKFKSVIRDHYTGTDIKASRIHSSKQQCLPQQ